MELKKKIDILEKAGKVSLGSSVLDILTYPKDQYRIFSFTASIYCTFLAQYSTVKKALISDSFQLVSTRFYSFLFVSSCSETHPPDLAF